MSGNLIYHVFSTGTLCYFHFGNKDPLKSISVAGVSLYKHPCTWRAFREFTLLNPHTGVEGSAVTTT